MKKHFTLYFCVFLFIITLTPRVIVLNLYSTGISNDSYEYLSLASNLYNHKEYTISKELYRLKDSAFLWQQVVNEKRFPESIETEFGSQKTMFRDPGYPLFIAAIYSIFGENFDNVSLVQIFLQSLSAVLIFLTLVNILKTSELRGIQICIISFTVVLILVSFHPGLIVSSRNILRESFEFFLFSAILYCFSGSQRAIGFVIAAVISSILILTMQSMKYMLYLLSLYVIVKILIAAYRGNDIILSGYLKKLFTYLIITFVLIQIWPVRNYINFGIYKASSFGIGSLALINAMEIEKQANANETHKDFCDKYNVSEKIKEYYLPPFDTISELRRTFLKKISTSDERFLITSDREFKPLAFKIYSKNTGKIFNNYIKSLYGTLRIDHFADIDYGKTGRLRYNIKFHDIFKGNIQLWDMISIFEWITFLLLFGFFFVSKKVLFLYKIIFVSYLLPYLVLSSLGGIEDRVTIIFNLFICISLVNLIVWGIKNMRNIIPFFRKAN